MSRGYPSRVEDVDKTHEDMPTQNVITRVSGPGYYYTSYVMCGYLVIVLLIFIY